MQTVTQVRQGAYYEYLWGYDQTNVDFIVVVEVSSTGKTALCRRAQRISVDPQRTSEGITPGVAFGPAFRLHIRPNGSLVGSYPFIVDPAYNGTRQGWQRGYFRPIQFGDVSYETRPEFGH